MAKPNLSMLILDPPNELVFSGPFTEVVTSFLKLTNALDQPVCFKVKTTAPKMYCVRPNSGTIDPKAHVDVAIMLQPFDYDTLDKTKHKFMVQSILAPQPPIDMDKLWKEADPNSIVNTKLKCMFEMPVDASAAKQTVSDHAATNVAPSIKLNPNYPVVPNEPQSQVQSNDESAAAALRQRKTLGVNEPRNEPGEKDTTRSGSKSRAGLTAGAPQAAAPASSALRERYIQHQAQNAPAASACSIQHILQLFTSAPVIVSIIISLIIGMIVAKLFF